MFPVRLHSTSSLSDWTNTFLQEIDHNPHISKEVRNEVNKRYKASTINASYIFPRKKLTSYDLYLFKNKPKSFQNLPNPKKAQMEFTKQ